MFCEHRADAAVAWHADGLQLRVCARELCARTDAQNHASFRYAVERREGMRQRDGVAQEREQDGGAEPDALRGAGHRAEQ